QGAEDKQTLGVMVSLGRVRLQKRNYVEAEGLLRDALKLYEKIEPDGWERYNCQNLLGATLAAPNRFADAEAESLLISGYEGMLMREARIAVPDRFNLVEAAERIVKLYEGRSKPAKVSEWKQKLATSKSHAMPK